LKPFLGLAESVDSRPLHAKRKRKGFPMTLRHASLFSQLLQHFPRTEFARLVSRHQAEHGSKGFTCWTQLVAMLFCHLARAESLREICTGMACCLGKLSHLGVDQAPKKSTLSYANKHRPAALYEDLFWTALKRMRQNGGLGRRKKKFRFRHKLLSLDTTTITLCLSIFDWASFRRTKGGVKVHVLLDHDDYMPRYVFVRNAREHDRIGANLLSLNPGSIIAFDRAYNDYALFRKWTREGVYFVTRMKSNADYDVLEERTPPQRGNVVSDETIRFSGVAAFKRCPLPMRRVVVWDEAKSREIVLLTNILHFGPTTISDIYKDRWEIESFFRALKQNLKVKTFIGTTRNALLIQLWTALIALLLLRWLSHLSRSAWSFSTMAAMLRMNLFTYRDLRDWLKAPFGQPNAPPQPEIGVQLELALAVLGQPRKI
jgi:hypothetical protein